MTERELRVEEVLERPPVPRETLIKWLQNGELKGRRIAERKGGWMVCASYLEQCIHVRGLHDSGLLKSALNVEVGVDAVGIGVQVDEVRVVIDSRRKREHLGGLGCTQASKHRARLVLIVLRFTLYVGISRHRGLRQGQGAPLVKDPTAALARLRSCLVRFPGRE
jgi:hypothetical protein